MSPPLLNVREVAERFNVVPATVYRWVKDGTLQPVRIGGSLRFRPEDVDRLISEGAA